MSALANSTRNAAIASSGTTSLLVWEDGRAGDPDVYAGRLSLQGRVLDGSGIPIAVTNADETSPAVAWNGSTFLVVWQDHGEDNLAEDDLLAVRVSAEGEVLDADPIAVSTANHAQRSPSVASDGVDFFVAWEDNRVSPAIFGARVTSEGEVLDLNGIPISTGPGDKSEPAVAMGGGLYLLLWADGRSGEGRDVFAARVTLEGVVLDSAGIPVSEAADNQVSPTVNWNGIVFVSAWADLRSAVESDVYAARIASDGTVLDVEGFPVSTAQGNQDRPVVIWEGRNSLVVWEDFRSGVSIDLVGARVSQDGVVLDATGFGVSRLEQDELGPAVALATGGRVLIAYERLAPERPYLGVDRTFFRFFRER
jgi:protocatechuate 3,4-dioxygenase beta subunit